MKRFVSSLVSVAMLAAVAACGAGKDDVSSFRAAVPDDASVTISAPQKQNANVGDTSFWWGATLAATVSVNGGVLAVLDLMHNIVALPPTSHPSADVYVWGPGNGSPLDPNVYELTVTDDGNGTYDYALTAKGKNDPDSAFVTVISGQHTPVVASGANDPNHGNGNFTLDWSKRNTLQAPNDDAQGRPLQGTWVVTYDHKTADVSVDVAFNNVLDSNGNVVNETYHYVQPSGGDGKFQFSTDADVNNNGSALEHITVESRWKQDGSGRSDLNVSSGDVPAGQIDTASECWDTNFKVSFDDIDIATTTDPVNSQSGAETSCSFAAAEYYTD